MKSYHSIADRRTSMTEDHSLMPLFNLGSGYSEDEQKGTVGGDMTSFVCRLLHNLITPGMPISKQDEDFLIEIGTNEQVEVQTLAAEDTIDASDAIEVEFSGMRPFELIPILEPIVKTHS